MTVHLSNRSRALGATRVLTRQEVEDICLALEAEMEALIGLVGDETALVRAGRLFSAGELQDRKAVAARKFIESFEAVQKMRAEMERAAPGVLDRLRRRHEEFRSVLQLNMAVLSAAREVSENLIEDVAQGIGKPTAPRAYGRAGGMEGGQGAARGLAVDTSL